MAQSINAPRATAAALAVIIMKQPLLSDDDRSSGSGGDGGAMQQRYTRLRHEDEQQNCCASWFSASDTAPPPKAPFVQQSMRCCSWTMALPANVAAAIFATLAVFSACFAGLSAQARPTHEHHRHCACVYTSVRGQQRVSHGGRTGAPWRKDR